MKHALFLSVLMLPAMAFAADGDGKKETGMPQLDPEFWASQIFWLFISFGFLYWMMAKHALPYVRSILDIRDQTIRTNLEQASQIRGEAEDIKIKYDKNLRQADTDAAQKIKRVTQELDEMMANKVANANDEIMQRLNNAEKDIRKNEASILDQANKEAEDVATIMLDKLDDYVKGAKL